MSLSQEEQHAFDKLQESFMKPELREGVDILVLDTACDGNIIVELADAGSVDVGGEYVDVSSLIANGESKCREELCDAAGAERPDAVLADIVPDGIDSQSVLSIDRHDNQVLARLSAPGYLDATEYSHFDTVDEAKRHLVEMYGQDCDLDEDASPSP